MILFLAYLLTGVIAGVLSGLFGIGGGVIIIPILLFILPYAGINPNLVAHIAVATSLASIIFTGIVSAGTHQKRGNVDLTVFRLSLIPMIMGIILATIFAHYVPGRVLVVIFGIFLLLVSIKMLLPTVAKAHNITVQPRRAELIIAVFFMSILSALVGVGGGTLFLPYFQRYGLTMLQSVGTTAACGVVIGLVSAISYIILSWHLPGLPGWSLGYVYLPALLGIIITSMLFAPVGVKLATKLPAALLKKCFAVLLIVIAIEMLV